MYEDIISKYTPKNLTVNYLEPRKFSFADSTDDIYCVVNRKTGEARIQVLPVVDIDTLIVYLHELGHFLMNHYITASTTTINKIAKDPHNATQEQWDEFHRYRNNEIQAWNFARNILSRHSLPSKRVDAYEKLALMQLDDYVK